MIVQEAQERRTVCRILEQKTLQSRKMHTGMEIFFTFSLNLRFMKKTLKDFKFPEYLLDVRTTSMHSAI